jgi:hypothetical protein
MHKGATETKASHNLSNHQINKFFNIEQQGNN